MADYTTRTYLVRDELVEVVAAHRLVFWRQPISAVHYRNKAPAAPVSLFVDFLASRLADVI